MIFTDYFFVAKVMAGNRCKNGEVVKLANHYCILLDYGQVVQVEYVIVLEFLHILR